MRNANKTSGYLVESLKRNVRIAGDEAGDTMGKTVPLLFF